MTEDFDFPCLIGLYSPFPRMGKSIIAQTLAEEFGYKILKFSQPIKDQMFALGLYNTDIEGDGKDLPHPILNGLTPREKMHQISNDLFRTHGNDYLSIILKDKLDQHIVRGYKIVIDDVRFQENYNLIKSYHGGQVWRIGYGASQRHVPAYDTERLERLAFDLDLENIDNTESILSLVLKHFQK